jgi:hypothetical protein
LILGLSPVCPSAHAISSYIKVTSQEGWAAAMENGFDIEAYLNLRLANSYSAQRAAALSPYSAGARGILADAYVQLCDFDNAVRVLNELVRLKPNLSPYRRISRKVSPCPKSERVQFPSYR